MSVIYEKIRADMLGARKSRNTDLVKVYSTLVGELELIGKRKNVDVDDTQVISTLKKFISNLHITREKQSEIPIVDIIDNEIRLYNMYLPQQLTADAINDAINEYLNDGPFQNCHHSSVTKSTSNPLVYAVLNIVLPLKTI